MDGPLLPFTYRSEYCDRSTQCSYSGKLQHLVGMARSRHSSGHSVAEVCGSCCASLFAAYRRAWYTGGGLMWKIVERAANIATIFAFLAACYAIVFPATVSAFLSEISESNQRLADEIPFWITLNGEADEEVWAAYSEANPESANFTLPLKNDGNYPINSIVVRVYAGDGTRVGERTNVFLAPFGQYVIYESAPTSSFVNGMSVCIAGYSERAQKTLYERRVLRVEGLAGMNNMYTVDYKFTDQGWPNGCEN